MSKTPKIFGVILAGGSGTRFWPKSRKLKPKQLCKIGHPSKTMLELTLERIDSLVPKEQRLIVTHKDQLPQTKEITSKLCANFIPEPEAKNTLAALTSAALYISKSDPDALMFSLHADHVINDYKKFLVNLNQALKVAESGKLTLIGIKPTHPETGFGYIEKGEALSNLPGFKVQAFREKPNLKTAESYLASGKFLWNMGAFIWPVSLFLNEVKKYSPEVFETLQSLSKNDFESSSKVFSEKYASLKKISVDEAILEKSDHIAVVEGVFDWQDVGSWDALQAVIQPDKNGNIILGDSILIDSTNTTVDSDGPLVTAIGLKDMVVVVSGGAVLVCPRSRSQDVKKIVEELEKTKRQEFL